MNLTELFVSIFDGGYSKIESFQKRIVHSAGFRRNEAPCLGPEGGRPGRPTQAVRHTYMHAQEI